MWGRGVARARQGGTSPETETPASLITPQTVSARFAAQTTSRPAWPLLAAWRGRRGTPRPGPRHAFLCAGRLFSGPASQVLLLFRLLPKLFFCKAAGLFAGTAITRAPRSGPCGLCGAVPVAVRGAASRGHLAAPLPSTRPVPSELRAPAPPPLWHGELAMIDPPPSLPVPFFNIPVFRPPNLSCGGFRTGSTGARGARTDGRPPAGVSAAPSTSSTMRA